MSSMSATKRLDEHDVKLEALDNKIDLLSASVKEMMEMLKSLQAPQPSLGPVSTPPGDGDPVPNRPGPSPGGEDKDPLKSGMPARKSLFIQELAAYDDHGDILRQSLAPNALVTGQ